MNVSDLGEFGLIEKIRKYAPMTSSVVKGIGDDTAVLRHTKDKYLLFTTDMLVEGTHFKRRMGGAAIGHKALACSISDIAAMGGVPAHAVVSLGLGPRTPLRFVEEMYKAMAALAKRFGVSIVGGDTVRSDKIVINVALLGEVEKKHLVTRSGARPGDWIFVTGTLGRSLATGKHLNFTPRLKEARFLVKNFKPSAMIDISDGLAGDLNHILKASRVGARLWDNAVPLTGGATLAQALTDGEDFELLFTLKESQAMRLLKWQNKRRSWFFYPIGEITADTREQIHARSYTHF
ncbi:MAG: thiamine-phosphate kinase [Candidatus Omnitrophota bacterium]|nr:thiamine-phosphate kinase [Candidatus Omnitrophota bacterium]